MAALPTTTPRAVAYLSWVLNGRKLLFCLLGLVPPPVNSLLLFNFLSCRLVRLFLKRRTNFIYSHSTTPYTFFIEKMFATRFVITAALVSVVASLPAHLFQARQADLQSSLTLDKSLVVANFSQDGQFGADVALGQVRSATSTNNFINFCKTVNVPLMDGTQQKTAYCNPVPMGILGNNVTYPATKFVSPKNFGTVPANKPFDVVLAMRNFVGGQVANLQTNYMAAPQTTGANGLLNGHQKIVIEQIESLAQTTPTDPNRFAFFSAITTPVANGQLTKTVDKGLPAGVYRAGTIISTPNGQPLNVPQAQRGILDDVIYFTVQ